MKAEHINLFMYSVVETFKQMLGCEVKHGKPIPATYNDDIASLIGLIGLSGTAKGIIAIKLPPETAMNIVGAFVGTKFTNVDSTVIDGVGELVNIIAGSTKSKMIGQKISISLPTVLKGSMQKLTTPEVTYMAIPFFSHLGNFEVYIGFSSIQQNKKEALHEGVNC
ncbi:MAG: chemotaxis protein CheX [Candidatus Zixiibacteriota bacterium]